MFFFLSGLLTFCIVEQYGEVWRILYFVKNEMCLTERQNQQLRGEKCKLNSMLRTVKDILNSDICDNIDTPTQEDLTEKASKMTAAMMQALTKRVKLRNQDNERLGEKYSQAMREFSLSLHNISPAAYRYVRDSLDCVLPNESTLHRWMAKVDCSPGLHQQEKDIFELS